jgi:hypothetical protein
MRMIYSRYPTRPISLSLREENTQIQGTQVLVRICQWVGNLPLPSVLLANVQLLDNKLDDLCSRLSYQRDIKNCNILCFTESGLNDDMDNKQLAGFSMHWQDETAASGKTRDGGLCLFVNNSWCAKSNIKEFSTFCSPEVEYHDKLKTTLFTKSVFIYIFRTCLFTTTNRCWH